MLETRIVEATSATVRSPPSTNDDSGSATVPSSPLVPVTSTTRAPRAPCVTEAPWVYPGIRNGTCVPGVRTRNNRQHLLSNISGHSSTAGRIPRSGVEVEVHGREPFAQEHRDHRADRHVRAEGDGV